MRHCVRESPSPLPGFLCYQEDSLSFPFSFSEVEKLLKRETEYSLTIDLYFLVWELKSYPLLTFIIIVRFQHTGNERLSVNFGFITDLLMVYTLLTDLFSSFLYC